MQQEWYEGNKKYKSGQKWLDGVENNLKTMGVFEIQEKQKEIINQELLKSVELLNILLEVT